jgi:hypothetical protein
LVDNPQYTLIIEKGRFAEKYFSSSDPVKNTEAAILWDRIKDRPTSMESDMNLIEKELLNNPKSVFFGPVLGTRLRFKSIPCYIEASSGSLYKVSQQIAMPSKLQHFITRNNLPKSMKKPLSTLSYAIFFIHYI